MSDPILRLEGVQTDIAQYHILQGVDLEVPRGKVTMLLGRNGVGKTTTLRTIMGHWRAKAGRITFDGAEITARPTPAIARTGVGFVPEDMGITSPEHPDGPCVTGQSACQAAATDPACR